VDLDLTELSNPKTVGEAVAILMHDLSSETLAELRQTPEDELIDHHLGLGRFIRNVFGLHGGNLDLLQDSGTLNPDDASLAIIRALWHRLRLH
jgi:hypothetical protein